MWATLPELVKDARFWGPVAIASTTSSEFCLFFQLLFDENQGVADLRAHLNRCLCEYQIRE